MVVPGGGEVSYERGAPVVRATEREFFIDNLMVRIDLIIDMILVDRPCAMGVEFPFSGSLTYTFLGAGHKRPFEGDPSPVLGAVAPFLSNFGENCPEQSFKNDF